MKTFRKIAYLASVGAPGTFDFVHLKRRKRKINLMTPVGNNYKPDKFQKWLKKIDYFEPF